MLFYSHTDIQHEIQIPQKKMQFKSHAIQPHARDETASKLMFCKEKGRKVQKKLGVMSWILNNFNTLSSILNILRKKNPENFS